MKAPMLRRRGKRILREPGGTTAQFINLNLLPRKQHLPISARGRQFLMLAAIGVIILALLFQDHQRVDDRVVTLEQQLRSLQAQEARLKDIEPQATMLIDEQGKLTQVLEAGAEDYRAFQATFVAWAGMVAVVFASLPPEITLLSLEQGKQRNAISVRGEASSVEAISRYAEGLSQSNLFQDIGLSYSSGAASYTFNLDLTLKTALPATEASGK